MNRRTLLKAGAAVGGGLMVGVWVLGRESGAGNAELFAPNAFIRIPKTGPIRVVVGRVEMGQGTATSTAMLIAEELEVDPSTLEVELAGADRAYSNSKLNFQLTGGSTSVASDWEPLRHAGASAREMLKEAAALRWNVPRGELTAKHGVITHASGKSATYGELAGDAAKVTIRSPDLKTKDFTVIGKPMQRLDAVSKTNGSANFGIDVQVPGALVAVIVRCPVHTGTVKSFDGSAALALPGVKHVVSVPQGVAVVAETYWHARQGANVVTVEWDEGSAASVDSVELRTAHRALLTKANGKRRRDDGKADDTLKAATKKLEAEYFAPFLAHATLEPQNATAHVTADRCEIWAPTQSPAMALALAARITHLPPEKIVVHQTLLGGGFGRRLGQDYVGEAVEVSRAIGGPVKVVWSREDDMRRSFYRPAATHALSAALDETRGVVTAWKHHVVSQSIFAHVLDSFVGGVSPGGPEKLKQKTVSLGQKYLPAVDPTSYEGADSMAYGIEHVAVDFTFHDSNVPTGFWRSVGHSHTAFATESFIDECAWGLGKDPAEFRRTLLAGKSRHLACLELATKQAGWASPLDAGHARGVAVHESFGSVVACVVEASVEADAIRVHRVVMASDCGRVINPDGVRAQLESAAIFGLSAALKQRITFEKGRVQQSNFHDFAPLRMSEAPRIETHLVPSEAEPTGIGEPGVPVMAPALANAVYALTKKRLRTLPLSLDEAT
ncbi:MAG: xanthine dehydrogenase family protein molybdopterin-binding subunit [Myxococcales bacterium]|nr:xanthine dehydrogenase family protein molybdopterin-binding subunit [Myxococcales bacterium]